MGANLIKITDILDRYLNLKGVYSEANSFRYLQIILEGRQDYGFKSSTEIKTVELTVTALNTVNVPTDFVDYVRIGTIVDQEIYTLTKNNNIRLNQGLNCGQELGGETTPIPSSSLWVPDFSATGGRNFLYYRYDKDLRRIVFQGDGVGRTIILEYLTDGVSVDGETYVPADMGKMLIAYLESELKLYGDKEMTSLGDTEYYRRNYEAEKQKYTRNKLCFTADELLDTIRGTYRQTLKR
jgi:hypothetical protein